MASQCSRDGCDPSEERGQDAVEELRAAGRTASHIRTYTGDPTSVEAAATAAIAELGGLDIWVNVAGICPVHLRWE